MIFGDNPTEISPDLLRKFDAEQPGKYCAQPKADGWRRFAERVGGSWKWRSKPGNARETIPVPDDLRAEFESQNWPPDIIVDLEWVGNHRNHQQLALYVFDLIILTVPFIERYARLKMILRDSKRVHLMPMWFNPDLPDRFMEQYQTDGLMEGLVVRRADSRIIGHPTKCVTNPHVFKIKMARDKEMKR